MRIAIVNGTVVNAEGAFGADVVIDGPSIRGIGSSGDEFAVGADRVIDASGKYVIPGGIDPHTHFELPAHGTVATDTFETGTRAAAIGGTTTVIDFATQSRGASLSEGLEAWHRKADGLCAIDYGFHMVMSDVNKRSLEEVGRLVEEGVTDFKLYTAYPDAVLSDDGAIFRAMSRATETGALIMIHAENGLAIDAIAERMVAEGKVAPYYHALSRPPILEGEATHRALTLAEAASAPVYFVHLSARQALDHLRAARARGLPAFAETCPQYLLLTIDDMGTDFEGAKYVISPPLRTAEHCEALWAALRNRDIDVVATDHAPFSFEQKQVGRSDFRNIPNGMPGVEDRIDLLHDAGVVAGRISLGRWVELTSTSPAKLFGLFPQKGMLAPGSDADVVVYDPTRKRTISADDQHMGVDYNPWEGRVVQGRAETVISRGKVVVDRGSYVGSPGDGRYVKRRPSSYLTTGI
jgi:dihydropyrimidinase